MFEQIKQKHDIKWKNKKSIFVERIKRFETLKEGTHHTKVQILFNPLLRVLELVVQAHDVEGV